MKRKNDIVDVAVVGGGAVGLAIALGLARRGVDVALIGAASTVRDDGRTAALMRPSLDLLADIGVYDQLAGHGYELAAIRLIDITGGLLRAPSVTFRASEIGLPAFAENFANATIVQNLMAALAQTPAKISTALVQSVNFKPDKVELVLPHGKTQACRLVIGADGALSPIRSAAGIGDNRWAYEQVALTFHVRHSRDHEDISTEFHTRSGPLTFVPFGPYTSSVVWMVTPAEAATLRALTPQELAVACQKRSSSLLGDLTLTGPAGAVPMRGLMARNATGPRTMLAGEALHVFPPVGAQGLNLGLRDAEGVITAVANAVAAGDDPGGTATLEAYARSRRLDTTSRTFGVDLLNRSLIAGVMPLDLLRAAGLSALSHVPPLRQMMMRAGMGMPLLGR